MQQGDNTDKKNQEHELEQNKRAQETKQKQTRNKTKEYEMQQCVYYKTGLAIQ